MAVRPLRPATDRRLGEPLPHQLANQARAPLRVLGLAIPSFDLHLFKGRMSCGISVPFDVIPRSKAGHPRVTHPFATLLIPFGTFAFDLHVLGTPPALILSQDQTLMLSSLARHRPGLRRSRIRAQLVNARPIYWLCVVQSVLYVSWFAASRLRTD